MTFTTTKLAGSQYLVEGTDVRDNDGSCVLDGTEWDRMVQAEQVSKAHKEFDASIEKFFEPITKAADQLAEAHTVRYDPLLYIVEQSGSEGAERKDQVLRELAHDTVILRAIAKGQANRLIWVQDQLVVTAATPEQEVSVGAVSDEDNGPNTGTVQAEPVDGNSDDSGSAAATPEPDFATH